MIKRKKRSRNCLSYHYAFSRSTRPCRFGACQCWTERTTHPFKSYWICTMLSFGLVFSSSVNRRSSNVSKTCPEWVEAKPSSSNDQLRHSLLCRFETNVCLLQVHEDSWEPSHLRHPLLRGEGQVRVTMVARTQLQRNLTLRPQRQTCSPKSKYDPYTL